MLIEDFQGYRQQGRWTLENERLRVLTDDEPAYTGTITGDVMRLRAEDQDSGSVQYVLNRQ